MNTALQIIELGQYLMYFFNIHIIISETIDRKKISKASIPLLIAYSLLIIINVKLRFIHTFISVLLYAAICISHRKIPLKALYVTMLYLFIDGMISPIIIMILDFLVEQKYFNILSSSISLLINAAFFFLFKRYMNKNGENLRLSLKLMPMKVYILIFIYIGIISVFNSFIMVASQKRIFGTSLFTVLKACIIFTSILSVFIMMFIITSNLSAYYYKKSASLLDKQLAMQARYYEKMDYLSNDIRRFRHDYKNHMFCLNSLLNENKTEDAIKYLESITNNQTMQTSTFRSGNTIADTILNDKNEIAAKNECKLNFTGVISPCISAFDICTILANALDNSIEACQKIPDGNKRFIDVNCFLKRDIQIICISNPNSNDNPNLQTSKENKTDHGFGLFNIKKTVEKLGGTVNVTQQYPIFVLDIMFTVPADKESEQPDDGSQLDEA